MNVQDKLLEHGFDPTFLFAWKGFRTENEAKYHSHENFEVCFIMSGKGCHKIDDVIYNVKEGDVILINPGSFHQSLLGPTKEPIIEFYFGLSNLQLEGCAPNAIPLKDDQNIMHTEGDLKLKLMKLCLAMDAERDSMKCGRYFMMKTYAMQFILYLLREHESLQPPKEETTSKYSFDSLNKRYIVEKMIDYFENHYAEKISLDTISENMYLSPFYISRIFKAETGDTPIRYLINIRLERAKEILSEDATLSIQEVAAKVGYDDAYHFSKLFKKQYGMPPSSVRKKNTSDS